MAAQTNLESQKAAMQFGSGCLFFWLDLDFNLVLFQGHVESREKISSDEI